MQHPRSVDRPHRTGGHHRGPSVLLALLAAIVAGAALTFAGRFTYTSTADLRVAGQVTTQRLAAVRTALMDHAWQRIHRPGERNAMVAEWSVATNGPQALRLTLTATNQRRGFETVRDLARGFCAHMESIAQEQRTTPTEAETLLSEYVADLQARLDTAEAQVTAAMSSLPEDDPEGRWETLLTRWQDLRHTFGDTRRKLQAASTRAKRLEGELKPGEVTISNQARLAAFESDPALQQDLGELKVVLTELKLQMLNVWQQAGAPLEKLSLATDELAAALQHHPPEDNPPGTGADAAAPPEPTSLPPAIRADLDQATSAYREALRRFTQTWNEAFADVQQRSVDPYGPAIVDAYYRVRRQLRDFLYAQSEHLTAIRAGIDQLRRNPEDDTRFHVFHSELVRAFHTLQSAHHRFEFTAGRVDTADNFRLDAALKSGRGLKQRTQARITEIERELHANALEQARERRHRERQEASLLLDDLRQATDKTVDDLLALHGAMTETVEQSETIHRLRLEAETAATRLKLTQKDLARMRERLDQLRRGRLQAADAVNVQLDGCSTDPIPANLTERLRIGGIGAGLTMVIVLLAQWWITRQRT